MNGKLFDIEEIRGKTAKVWSWFASHWLRVVIAIVIVEAIAASIWWFKPKFPTFLTKKSSVTYSLKSAPKETGFALLSDNTKSRGFKALIGRKESAGTPEARFEVDTSWMEFALAGGTDVRSFVNQKQDGKDTILWKNVLTDTDARYQIVENGLKEDIILKSDFLAQRALEDKDKVTISFDLTTFNVLPRNDTSGKLGLAFMDAVTGEYRFHIEKPYLVDAAGTRFDAVNYKLEPVAVAEIPQPLAKLTNWPLSVIPAQAGIQSLLRPQVYAASPGNKWRLTLTLPKEWLADKNRSYPIILDPTVTHNTQTAFATGFLNRVKDEGSADNAPILIGSYHELAADNSTVGLWHMNEASATTKIPDGASAAAAGKTCRSLKLNGFNTNGIYWIDPDGPSTGNSPFQAYCDMTNHGGGWTLALDMQTSDGANRHYYDTDFWTGTAQYGSISTPFANDYKSTSFSQSPASEIMMLANNNGTQMGTATYSLVAPATGNTLYWMFNNLSNTTISGARTANAGSVGTNGRARNAGDAFIDNAQAIIINSTYQPLDAANETRLGTNYGSVCGTITCNGHNYGGWGGRHTRAGWGAYYEGAALNGYCSSQGGFGSNNDIYTSNNAFTGSGCGGGTLYHDVDMAVFVRNKNETAGTIFIKDSSASNNNGIPIGGPTFVQGKIGKARSFNGSSDYVQAIENGTLDLSGSITVEAWFKKTSSGSSYQGVIDKGRDGYGAWSLNVDETAGKVTFKAKLGGTNRSIVASTNYLTNEWVHVAGVYDGNILSIYQNGILSNSAGYTGALGTNDVALRIGAASDGLYFPGQIDEVRISNIARTADDVRQAYEYGRRTHPITIDFVTSPQAAYASGTSVTINNPYGTTALTSTLAVGDTIIFKENVGGTETIGQAVVSTITNTSTVYGTVTLAAAPSFPSGGYTTNAKVFKWQREYMDLTGSLTTQRDAITRLTMRVTDGSQGANVWLDDFRSNTNYINDNTPDSFDTATGVGTYSNVSIPSTLNRYFQYRAILSSWDTAVSPSFISAVLDYTSNVSPSTPTVSAPTNAATGVKFRPVTTLSSTDAEGDYIRYKIQIATDNGFTTNLQTFDQTSSQTGWSGQDVSGTAYSSGTTATYTVQSVLSTGTTYYLRAYAKDPAGGDTWSSASSTTSFTVADIPTASAATSVNPTSLTANWTGSATFTSYRLDVSTANDFSSFVTGYQNKTVTGTSASVTGVSLATGGTYYYRLRGADANGDTSSNSVTITVRLGLCSPALSGTLTISSSCRFEQNIDGVEGGNMTISPSSTLTINAGQTIAWNPGSSITIATGSAIAIANGAQLKQGYLWFVDSDGDGYASNLTQVVSASSPGSGYRRRNTMNSITVLDCGDSYFSTNNTCTVANGTSCTLGSQCTSGFCADGVCCNTACTGSTCQRCDSLSSAGAGTCGYISTVVDPDNECTASFNACSGNTPIGPSGNCSGTGLSCQTTGNTGSACATQSGICQTGGGCSGGSCTAVANAAAGTDPNNNCTASINACSGNTPIGPSGNCNGSGACQTTGNTAAACTGSYNQGGCANFRNVGYQTCYYGCSGGSCVVTGCSGWTATQYCGNGVEQRGCGCGDCSMWRCEVGPYCQGGGCGGWNEGCWCQGNWTGPGTGGSDCC